MSSTVTETPAGEPTQYAPPPRRPFPSASELRRAIGAPEIATAVFFAVLFAQPFWLLLKDWWTMPEAGHGLLLGPVAVWFAWKSGIARDARANHALGLSLLGVAVAIRFASGLAAELFTMRGSMLLAAIALIVYYRGFRQVLHWWLPVVLFGLSIPLPELITQALALPLQFKASQMGAWMLEARQIPVLLSGNVIRVPGQELFVTEACSGLRSLTALLSTAVLFGALIFQTPLARATLIAIAIPVAIVINGFRVFLTGFLVYVVSPEFGKGFMHITEGWLLFLVSLAMLGAAAWVIRRVEKRYA